MNVDRQTHRHTHKQTDTVSTILCCFIGAGVITTPLKQFSMLENCLMKTTAVIFAWVAGVGLPSA